MEALSAFSAAVCQDLAGFWPVFTGLGVLLSGIASAAVIPVLQDDNSFAQIRNWARQPGLAARYRDLITSGLHFADRFYGEARGLSWGGYCMCLLVAFVYPLFLWQLAWVLEGPASLAGISAFNETASYKNRWIELFVVWLYILFFVVFMVKFHNIEHIIQRVLIVCLDSLGLIGIIPENVVRAFVMIFTLLAIFAILAVAAVVAGVLVGKVVAVVAGLLVGAGVALGMRGASVTGVVVVVGSTIGMAGALSADALFGTGGAVVLLTVVILVPTANAILDHVSIQVSRWLLSDLVERRGAAWQQLMIILHVVADVIAAGLFLVLLAVLLPAILEGANAAYAAFGWPSIEWAVYLKSVQEEPLGKGLLVTGMLATTLIPTVLHLLAAGGALALPAIGGGRIEILANKPSTTLLDRIGFVGLIAISVFLSWTALVLVAMILWEVAGAFVGPLGNHLADLAECVGIAIGGPGAPEP